MVIGGTTSRGALALVAVFGIVWAVGGVAIPAFAAPVGVTTAGISYTADDAAVAAGATVTGYVPGTLAVDIPASIDIAGTTYAVTTIGPDAFFGLGITSVTIPNTVTTIAAAAFQNNQLSAVSIPDGVTMLDNYAFFNNPLTTMVIPDSVTFIGNSAFNATHLTSLTLGSGLTWIGGNAFRDSRLTSLVIPPSVTTINLNAFYNNLLTTVTMGDGVTTIGGGAFTVNPLTTVTIDAAATSIGDNAFTSTAGTLTRVNFLGPAPATVGVTPFDTSDPLLVYYPQYGAAVVAGGFTTPTWHGYRTTSVATVTYNANGHGSAPAPSSALVGQLLTAPDAPTAAGYTFAGWFTSADGGTQWNFASDDVPGNLTLFAHWDPALATTGIDPAPGLTAGWLAILLGLVLVMAARRSRPTASVRAER
jgi:uncharacterized repeat protein (TIGR02543 family)